MRNSAYQETRIKKQVIIKKLQEIKNKSKGKALKESIFLRGVMDDCLFCRIVKKEIKSDIVFENDSVLIFKDINPKAPVHLLVIPKRHIADITEIDSLSAAESCEILSSISKTALELGLEKGGFRVVINTGVGAGQSVAHLHFHILGKRNFAWPPG